ncbi:MAG TPA: hypothetical protein PLT00_04445 [Verrucomicrobiota bacterium]|jgi:hypothetical protein|nr:MAG: hypothetical protein BWX84_01911 [Verrucomicrobia bacterium ADurb.Bin118]HPY29361.1 hypothetical protein [Verrucomicrobiota bacterium]HQB15945.1 hypothetical protein [Verrucomicrobiota bacterium]
MKTFVTLLALGAATACTGLAAEPALTIYNQNFAVVRDTVPLDLKPGVNEVRFAGATAHVEPDSVILRDPAGQRSLQILEQNYRNDPVSQELLLSLFEGQTIDFQWDRLKDNTTVREVIPGKIIRSGYDPGGRHTQPIIEVGGKLQFRLPGQPLFPSLGDDTVLKPAFNWLLRSDQPGRFDAEVGYVTGGFQWEADYNLVAPEQGDFVDLIGWITMNNHSGTTFRDAKIKLMAGDVQKIQPQLRFLGGMRLDGPAPMAAEAAVTEKSFDEFHLYTLARPTTLRDRETKQVEFVRAERVHAPVNYVYDGAGPLRFRGGLNQERGYGAGEVTKKVRVTREFVNAETNQLGLALPAGKLRFYRRNDDGQLEFTGEDRIDHTPRQETVRVTTGHAFDLVGERKQMNFRVDTGDKWLEETFTIKLRNRKPAPVEIRVVEHLHRWSQWDIRGTSHPYRKTDAQTIEFQIAVPPDVEQVVTYTAYYTW